MGLLQQFNQFIKEEDLVQSGDRLLLAVSGGLDSVVLTELCAQSGHDFIIAHCNFQLRGAESERDEKFVKDLGIKYSKESIVKHFDTDNYAVNQKISVQVAARQLRYGWFEELANSRPGQNYKIVTAHHRDDNIETLLMNFFKGTGISGLRGMLPKNSKVIRPLLFAPREQLQNFAVENGLEWVEDSSNEQDKYTRNYFRNRVIPMITGVYPEATSNLAANLNRFREIEMLYRQSIEQHKKKLIQQKGPDIHIPVLKLLASEPLQTIIYEIVKEYHFSVGQVREIIGLCSSNSGKFIVSASHRILKNRNWLIISPLPTDNGSIIVIEEDQEQIIFKGGALEFKRMKSEKTMIPESGNIALLDAGELQFPLLFRAWKAGDYFYPLGMRKKKKLARFFIDHKLSKTDKEKIWVLEMDKKIIWIAGMRIDDRFKITPGTREILYIELRVT